MASTSVMNDSRKRKLKSPVWDYCTPNEAHTQAVCNICSKKFKLVKSCTSGLSQHLSSAHQIHVEGGGGKRCTYYDPNTPTTCMICEDVCDEGIPTKKALPWEETYNLDSQLSVILLVRKILNVPKDAVETVLRTKGDPSTWGLKMCGPCRRIFTEAEFLNSRINQLNREFSQLSNLLRRQVKKDWCTEEATVVDHEGGISEKNVPKILESQKQIRRRPGQKRKRPRGVRPNLELPVEKDKALCETDDIRRILLGSLKSTLDPTNSLNEDADESESNKEILEETFVEFSNVGKLEPEAIHESNANISSKDENSLSTLFAEGDDGSDCGGDDNFLDDDNGDSDYVAEEVVHNASSKVLRPKRSSSKSKVEESADEERIDVFAIPQPVKDNDQYICPLCPRRMLLKCAMHGHILRAHYNDKSPFHCHLCSKSFKRETILRTHLRLHHDGAKTPLDDPDDDGVGHEQEDLFEELDNDCGDTRNRKYKCDECPKKKYLVLYKSLETLEAHKRRDHQGIKKPFECKVCGKSFRSEIDLRHHLFVHKRRQREKKDNATRPFCLQCNREFKNMLTLKKHFRKTNHTSRYPFCCEVCGEGFMQEAILETHKAEKHEKNEVDEEEGKVKNDEKEEKEKFFCVPCNREFENVTSFKAHLKTRVHVTDSNFWCELCSKEFMQKQSLLNHQALEHYKELKIEPFKCSYCAKILSSERQLDHHIRIKHTKDTKYKCEECDLGFMYVNVYNNHMSAVHAKEKPFLCTQCPKRFGMKVRLTEHMRIHSGDKPYKCKHCAKEYSDRPTFRRHLETHGEQVHVCAICHKQFKVWHSYRLHMRAVHNHAVYKRLPPPCIMKGKKCIQKLKAESDIPEFLGGDMEESAGAPTSSSTTSTSCAQASPMECGTEPEDSGY